MPNNEIPTKEELAVEMTRFNKRLWAVQEQLEDVMTEMGDIMNEMGDTLRPILRDYYNMVEEY